MRGIRQQSETVFSRSRRTRLFRRTFLEAWRDRSQAWQYVLQWRWRQAWLVRMLYLLLRLLLRLLLLLLRAMRLQAEIAKRVPWGRVRGEGNLQVENVSKGAFAGGSRRCRLPKRDVVR